QVFSERTFDPPCRFELELMGVRCTIQGSVMSGRFFHARWQTIAAPLLMVGSRLLRSTLRDQRRRAPASARSRHDFSRDGASGRLREVGAAPVRLTGRSRTTLWDAEPQGWVGEQEDGPTCITSAQ